MIGSVLAFCVILLLPLWLGKIGPNRFYGYRTAFAMANADNWRHMNRFVAGVFIPFFLVLSISDLFFTEKELVWVLFPGIAIGLCICYIEEWRMKFKQRRAAKRQKR